MPNSFLSGGEGLSRIEFTPTLVNVAAELEFLLTSGSIDEVTSTDGASH